MELIGTRAEENRGLQSELVKIARRSRRKRKIVFIAALCAAILVAFVAVWLYGRSQAKKNAEEEIAELKTMLHEQEKRIQELIETPIVVNPVAPEINLDIIYSEINEIAELATIEYLFTDAAKFSDSKQIKNWNIPFTEKSFLLKWDGVIKAGVKLDQVTVEINQDTGKILVSIPPAEIFSYEIDNDSVEVLDEKDNIFNNITVDDKIKFDTATEKAMKERAIENGLLDKAQENAEDILSRLLSADVAIRDYYTIEFVIIGR